MAFHAAVTNRFFQRLLPVLKRLNADAQIGPLSIAMLIPSPIDRNFRSLVLASPSLDKLGLSDATGIILEKLRDDLGEDANRINTVSVLRTASPAIRMLSEEYDIAELGTPYEIDGMASLALGLDHPILFLSKAVPVAA